MNKYAARGAIPSGEFAGCGIRREYVAKNEGEVLEMAVREMDVTSIELVEESSETLKRTDLGVLE
jgi:hypothetical protein